MLTEDDLDINNTESSSSSCGFFSSNHGTQIYGMTTEITTTEIAFSCAGANVKYSAVPVVQNGRVELTEIAVSNGLPNFIFSKDKLEKGFETGINDALAAKGVKPIGLTLQNGSLTILTEGATL